MASSAEYHDRVGSWQSSSASKRSPANDAAQTETETEAGESRADPADAGDDAQDEDEPAVYGATGRTHRRHDGRSRAEASSRVTRAQMEERMPRSAPDALRYEPGVSIQQTAHGQASPYVRGMTGQQVVHLFDGIRMNNILPGFIEKYDDLKKKGVETIACLSVNDAFVMGAWGKAQNVGDKVVMLADGSGELTKAIGMEFDLSARGLGLRSQRYSMLVDDGVVKQLNLEKPGAFEVSDASTLLGQI